MQYWSVQLGQKERPGGMERRSMKVVVVGWEMRGVGCVLYGGMGSWCGHLGWWFWGVVLGGGEGVRAGCGC